MISSMRLRNFKSYRDSGRQEFAPLTILVGPNNSGKSTLFDAILLLKQTIQDRDTTEPLITSGQLADLGSFHQILRGGRDGDVSRFTIEVGMGKPTGPFFRIEEGDQAAQANESQKGPPTDLSLTFGFDEDEERIYLSRFISSGKRTPTVEVRRSGKGYWSPSIPKDKRTGTHIAFNHFLPFIFGPRGTLDVGGTVSSTVYWTQEFNSLRYIGPLRTAIPRYAVRGRTRPHLPGTGGEQIERLLRQAEPSPREEEALIQKVGAWFSNEFALLRGIDAVNVDPGGVIRSLVGHEVAGFNNINVANMGEGISQLLPIVAEASDLTGGQTLIIEQPEIHLHPAAQAALGDLFIRTVNEKKRVQCLVETHSEHLLLRIRRRIAEGKADPDNLRVLYVDKHGGESRITELNLNERGAFESWPEGFFEEGYQEALALAEAAAKRSEDKASPK